MIAGDRAPRVLPEDPFEEPAGLLVHLGEGGPAGRAPLLLRVFRLELDAGVARQLLDGLAEGLPFRLHDETDRVPARAAAEAVEHALVGVDVEARRLLAVEGTEAFEV